MAFRHLPNVLYETARISIPTLFDAYRGTSSHDTFDERLFDWSARILRCADAKLNVVGAPIPPPSETFVVMSNHQSLYDIPIIYQTLKRRIRMVAKSELFKVPVWSQAMRASGMVELNRSDRRAALESLKKAGAQVREGFNLWIAPEGTRSRTGVLGPFKSGGFHLALEARVRILPITIVDSGRMLPAKGYVMTPGLTVTVAVHEPIDPQQYGRKRKDDLLRDVREVIASALPPEMRGDSSVVAKD
ncbi:MAG: lysophospholipid acyltransferase family protein [Polyangiaceae bacterium]